MVIDMSAHKSTLFNIELLFIFADLDIKYSAQSRLIVFFQPWFSLGNIDAIPWNLIDSGKPKKFVRGEKKIIIILGFLVVSVLLLRDNYLIEHTRTSYIQNVNPSQIKRYYSLMSLCLCNLLCAQFHVSLLNVTFVFVLPGCFNHIYMCVCVCSSINYGFSKKEKDGKNKNKNEYINQYVVWLLSNYVVHVHL